MKYLISLLIVLGCCMKSFSQEQPIKMLLGKTDKYVRNYLDSIARIYDANGVEFSEKMDKKGFGSMGLTSEEGEDFMDCLMIYCFFQQLGNERICIKQLIGGSPESANVHRAFLDRNYHKQGENS